MIEYEKFHFNTENRQSGKYLAILHPEYEEFGASGKRWKKADLPQADLDSSVYEIENYVCIPLSDSACLSKYILLNRTSGVRTNRSSVWVIYRDDWKMIFHQGTQID